MLFKLYSSDTTVYKKGIHKDLFDGRTFSRIGSDLHFDYKSCPKNSIMLNSAKLNAKPLHDNCPQVFIIGARKGGTTSLYQYLSKHPDFGGVRLDDGPSTGETFYFAAHYRKRPWKDYISEFPVNKTSGESSVGNLVDCLVPERMYKYCGRAVKIIILLRDPIDRYQSNFRLRVNQKRVSPHYKISTFLTKDFNHLYQSFEDRNINMNDLTSNMSAVSCLFKPAGNCIYEGLYYVHLYNWLCNFPAENILILSTEEFHYDSNRIFSQVLNFVGLRPLDDEILNTITKMKYNYFGRLEDEPDFRVLSSSEKNSLLKIYRPFNKKLLDLLKWHDLNWNN